MKPIDYLLVGELLDYNKITGRFYWKERSLDRFKDINHGKIWNSRFKGAEAGMPNRFGYMVIGLYGTAYYAHRLAWAHFYEEDPVSQIDHINGVRDDNRIENLRKASSSDNNRNSRAKSHSFHSKYKGVGWYESGAKWRMRIDIGGKVITKYFKDEIDAAISYDKMAEELFGEFAKTNKMMGLL
jgi:hypothetical protein